MGVSASTSVFLFSKTKDEPIMKPISSSSVQRHGTTTLHEPQRTHSAPHPAALTNGDVLDSSDAEVAQIDFRSSTGRVNLRTTKKNDVPRPMSWEGELSDGEGRDMCVDEEDERDGSQVVIGLLEVRMGRYS